MKPFVFLYLLSINLIDGTARKNARDALNRKLGRFCRTNPSFGRKMYRTNESKIQDVYFNDTPIKNTTNYFAHFDTSHLTAKYLHDNGVINYDENESDSEEESDIHVEVFTL